MQVHFWEDYSFLATRTVPLTKAQFEALNHGKKYAGSNIWPQTTGDIMANEQWITLTVAGNSNAPVTINDMEVVKSCQGPLKGGTLFFSPTAGAGPFSTATIYFNLDKPISVGQYQPGEGNLEHIASGGNFFAKKVVTLSYHEPQTFAIYVTTNNHYCQFTFKLGIATISGPVTETITNDGAPFGLTADGENGNIISHVRFPSYAIVYAGGMADQQHGFKFIRVNPAKYRGTGNPTSFPPP